MYGPAPIEIAGRCRWLAIFGQNEANVLYFLSSSVQKRSCANAPPLPQKWS